MNSVPELYRTRASGKWARSYNLTLVVWLCVFVLLFATGLKTLERMRLLPPPPFTATRCIDEKFRYLHGTYLSEIPLLAVGSSVTGRSLDVGTLKRHSQPTTHGPRGRPRLERDVAGEAIEVQGELGL